MSEPKVESIWRLLDIDRIDPSAVGFVLQANGKTYTIAVAVDFGDLSFSETLNACRATAAHICRLGGVELPADARIPEPGECPTDEETKQ